MGLSESMSDRKPTDKRTSDGRLILNYLPALTNGFADIYWEAVFAVAFKKLDVQVRVLSEHITNVRSRQSAARRVSASLEYEGVTRSIASLLLLRDLLQMGWTMNLIGPSVVELTQPAIHDNIDRAKQQIRESMHFERQDSLSPASVRDFVLNMEKPRIVGDTERNIFSLICDGDSLASDLQSARTAIGEQRSQMLREIIKPYLVLVEGEARDDFTNLRLMDIWRYFRLTWSTPYRSTPGRNLYYLVRDSGQPCHPIIGIAALSNCIIGLKCRDDRIGWTPDAIEHELLAANSAGEELFRTTACEIAEVLESQLETGLASIAIDSITTHNELEYPSEEGIASITKIAHEAARDRDNHLREESTDMENEFELVSPSARHVVTRDKRDSSEALFRRKRASKLAALLQAKLFCQRQNVFTNPSVGLPALLWTDDNRTAKSERGRSALRTILNANKETKIGSSMMEITVCGAIKPYSYLLGGKLVAMLLASPEIVGDYRDKYGSRASTIASRVAGHDITRDASLVYLGTSSLYVGTLDKTKFRSNAELGNREGRPLRPHSASQYNRIRIPAAHFGRCGEIRYEAIGTTEGFGVVHFAAETREALEELDMFDQGMKRVNSLFGEGTSPRLRKIRQGLSLLGLDERYLIHGQQRLVYGICLAHNSERFLIGRDTEPDYVLPSEEPASVSKGIADYWRGRWLSSRLDHEQSIESVRQFLPHDFAVSREYADQVDLADTSLAI